MIDFDDALEGICPAQFLKRKWGDAAASCGALGRGGGAAQVVRGEAGCFHIVAAAEFRLPLLNRVRDRRVKQIPEQRGFSGTAGAGDHDQTAQGQAQIEALEIAEGRALQLEPIAMEQRRAGRRFLLDPCAHWTLWRQPIRFHRAVLTP